MNKIVIVGASLAGLRAMETLRAEGYAGEIVAISSESFLPYDRPPLSKQFLTDNWPAEKLSLSHQGFEHLNAHWRLECVALGLEVSRQCVRIRNEQGLEEEVPFDGLMIATGSRVKTLPFGEGLAGIHVLRDLKDALALRAALQTSSSLVVVGGGFIGMEVAASARSLGIDVTVVEFLPTPLQRGLGRELGEYVASRHRDQGVEFRCGVGVESFEGSDRVSGVKLSDGSVISADLVLVGIGVVPNTEWLKGSGLNLDDGVLCDAKGSVGVSNIVAAGDVARWSNPLTSKPCRGEHWTAAVEQGTHAARRLLLGDDAVEPLAYVPYVWSDQFDLQMTMAGEIREGDDMHVCRGSLEEGRCLVLFGRAGRLTGAVGFRRSRLLNASLKMISEGTSWEEAIASHS